MLLVAVVLGVSIGFVDWREGRLVASAVLVALVILVGLVLGARLGAMAKVPLPYAYRLPGVRDGIPARSFSRRQWSLVGGGAVLVFLLLTVVSAPWWAYLALA
ncbi:MAG: hypothetical protein JWP10_1406, partial [Nocardioidaceae bacterium]|nr:hypothetical protein [Nocardioidaceae bacterium]